jgi:hypothetical protein
LETSICGQSCSEIFPLLGYQYLSPEKLENVGFNRNNIPSLKYSQYIAELRSLPTVLALIGSRKSLWLSLCKDHAEGISVIQCLALFKTCRNAIVVMSNCPSGGK